jgi:hypothetical protein
MEIRYGGGCDFELSIVAQKIENFTTIQSWSGAVLVQGNHISMASPIAIHKLYRIVVDNRIFQKNCSNDGAAFSFGLATS